MTSEVRKRARRGLLTKTRERVEARRVLVRLTDQCELRMRSLASLQHEVSDTLFAALTADDFAILWRVMPQMAADGDRAALRASYLLRSRGESDG